jgi:hypothetical protein
MKHPSDCVCEDCISQCQSQRAELERLLRAIVDAEGVTDECVAISAAEAYLATL